MKNVIIIFLSALLLAVMFLYLKSCKDKTAIEVTNPQINGIFLSFEDVPDDFPLGSEATLIDTPTAKDIINSVIPLLPGTMERDPSITRSAFFSFSDLKIILKMYKEDLSSEDLDGLGFRIYFGKYDSTEPRIDAHIENHLEYRDRPAAILQLMDVDNEQFLKTEDQTNYVTVNLGQLCPPRCPNAEDIFFRPTKQ